MSINGNGHEPFDVDAWLDGYQPATETVTIYQRADLRARYTVLEAALAQVGTQPDDTMETRARELLAEIGQVSSEMEASAKSFTVRGCGYERWVELMVAHPPTDEEREQRPNEPVGEAFQAHATASCVVEPELTPDQVRKLRTKLRLEDFDRLWRAVVATSEGPVEVGKSGLATAVENLLAQSSTPPPNRAQRRARSSAAGGGRSRRTTTTKKAD